MHVRDTRPEDLPRLLAIYEDARAFMAREGNPHQWGHNAWPPRELVEQDIREHGSHAVVLDASDAPGEWGRVVGVFFFAEGEDIDPSYRTIEGGTWAHEGPYGVIHRIASDSTVHGVGSTALMWALERCQALRVDTHPDNQVMQGLLGKLGFECRGIVHVEQDGDPRLAFERSGMLQP